MELIVFCDFSFILNQYAWKEKYYQYICMIVQAQMKQLEVKN